MEDPIPNLDGDETEDEPRSYAVDYVLLDRSDSDDPVWVLVRYEAVRAAALDENGNPTPEDWGKTIEWATQELMKVINPRRVPGSSAAGRPRGMSAPASDAFVYRLEDGEGV